VGEWDPPPEIKNPLFFLFLLLFLFYFILEFIYNFKFGSLKKKKKKTLDISSGNKAMTKYEN
jgi:hypothetical protein